MATEIKLQSIKFPGSNDLYTIPQLENNFNNFNSGMIPDAGIVKDKINNLNKEINDLNDGIDNLNDKIVKINNSLGSDSDNPNNEKSIYEQLNQHESEIANNTTNISTNKTSISINEANISKNIKNISTNTTSIANIAKDYHHPLGVLSNKDNHLNLNYETYRKSGSYWLELFVTSQDINDTRNKRLIWNFPEDIIKALDESNFDKNREDTAVFYGMVEMINTNIPGPHNNNNTNPILQRITLITSTDFIIYERIYHPWQTTNYTPWKKNVYYKNRELNAYGKNLDNVLDTGCYWIRTGNTTDELKATGTPYDNNSKEIVCFLEVIHPYTAYTMQILYRFNGINGGIDAIWSRGLIIQNNEISQSEWNLVYEKSNKKIEIKEVKGNELGAVQNSTTKKQVVTNIPKNKKITGFKALYKNNTEVATIPAFAANSLEGGAAVMVANAWLGWGGSNYIVFIIASDYLYTSNTTFRFEIEYE